MDFTEQTRKYLGKIVKVKTVDEVFIGKLIVVGSDFLTLKIIDDVSEHHPRILIRSASIIALLRVQDHSIEHHHHKVEIEEEYDDFDKFLLDME